jgi:hypothetical protein
VSSLLIAAPSHPHLCLETLVGLVGCDVNCTPISLFNSPHARISSHAQPLAATSATVTTKITSTSATTHGHQRVLFFSYVACSVSPQSALCLTCRTTVSASVARLLLPQHSRITTRSLRSVCLATRWATTVASPWHVPSLQTPRHARSTFQGSLHPRWHALSHLVRPQFFLVLRSTTPPSSLSHPFQQLLFCFCTRSRIRV